MFKYAIQWKQLLLRMENISCFATWVEYTLAMSKYFRLNIINRKFARLGSIISHVEKNVMCLELRQKRWRKNLQFILKCLA